MTITGRPPHQIFQDALEERHQVFIQRLAQLMASSRMPDRDGYDPAALQALIAWARQGVADAAMALRRISDGTYGVCERCGHDVPVGHLRMQPDTRWCAPCRRRQPTTSLGETSAGDDPRRTRMTAQEASRTARWPLASRGRRRRDRTSDAVRRTTM
jgi:RNA polymerase-binding transcription factor DksA